MTTQYPFSILYLPTQIQMDFVYQKNVLNANFQDFQMLKYMYMLNNFIYCNKIFKNLILILIKGIFSFFNNFSFFTSNATQLIQLSSFKVFLTYMHFSVFKKTFKENIGILYMQIQSIVSITMIWIMITIIWKYFKSSIPTFNTWFCLQMSFWIHNTYAQI